jgi:hypothetical protein
MRDVEATAGYETLPPEIKSILKREYQEIQPTNGIDWDTALALYKFDYFSQTLGLDIDTFLN